MLVLALYGCASTVEENEAEPEKELTAWDTCEPVENSNPSTPPMVCEVGSLPIVLCSDENTSKALLSRYLDYGPEAFQRAFVVSNRVGLCKTGAPNIITVAPKEHWRDGKVRNQRVEIYAIEVQDSEGNRWFSNYMVAQDEAI